MSSSSAMSSLLYAANLGWESPRTFSNMTAFGLAVRTNWSARGKRSRSSSGPSCLPATENGGHGTPPARRSRSSEYGLMSKSRTSPSMTFHSGRLARRVAAAWWSSSTAARIAKPARSSPSACPPAPAQISTEDRGVFIAAQSMGRNIGGENPIRIFSCCEHDKHGLDIEPYTIEQMYVPGRSCRR